MDNRAPNDNDEICYRCRGKGHWSHTCHTDKHFIDLYQAYKKGKRKIKTNLFDDSDPNDLTRLDVSNFFKGTRGKIYHLIADGNVYTN